MKLDLFINRPPLKNFYPFSQGYAVDLTLAHTPGSGLCSLAPTALDATSVFGFGIKYTDVAEETHIESEMDFADEYTQQGYLCEQTGKIF